MRIKSWLGLGLGTATCDTAYGALNCLIWMACMVSGRAMVAIYQGIVDVVGRKEINWQLLNLIFFRPPKLKAIDTSRLIHALT